MANAPHQGAGAARVAETAFDVVFLFGKFGCVTPAYVKSIDCLLMVAQLLA